MKKKSNRVVSLDAHRKQRNRLNSDRQHKAAEGGDLVDFTFRKKQKDITHESYMDDGKSSNSPRLPPHVRKNRAMVNYQKGPVFWLLLIGIPSGFIASVLLASWLFVHYLY